VLANLTTEGNWYPLIWRPV